MRVALVTGSRSWPNAAAITAALDAFKPELVLHGDCPTGADHHAAVWAKAHALAVPFPVLWKTEGGATDYSAGPRRNEKMVVVASILRSYGHDVRGFVCLEPDLPCRGTRDCLSRIQSYKLRYSIVEAE